MTHVELTTWPTSPLPQPEAPIAWPYELTEAGAIVAVTDPGPSPPPRPYHEAYLRLAEVDLEDEWGVMDFVLRFGPLAIASGEGEGPGFTWHSGYYRHRPLRDLLAEEGAAIVREIADWDEMAGEDFHFVFSSSLELFRFQARCLRDLLRAWRWIHDGVEPTEWESPVWQSEDPEMPLPTDRSGAARLLRQGIRDGLAPFRPELRLGSSGNAALPYGGGQPFYYICCLELFNHIADNAAYKVCANEPCGRLFVRQEGGARHGQHRTVGLKYCTPKCARAQAAREYRRRQRETKQRRSDG